MRPALDHIEQIERYLKGLMSSEERRDMENRLLTDATLQEELKLQQWMMQGIEQAGWREELNAIHETLPDYTELNAARSNWYGFITLSVLTGLISAYLYLAPTFKDEMIYAEKVPGSTGWVEDEYQDAVQEASPVAESKDDSVFWKPELKERVSQLMPAQQNIPDELPLIPAVHYYPPDKVYEKEYYTQWYKLKQFVPLEGSRMIILPVTSLDYDFYYQKEADALLDAKFNQLWDEKYEKTYIATISFRYRMEGAIIYNDKADVINLYMKNTHLLLWQVDSMAAELLKAKAIEQCQKRDFWLSGYEYFSWLASQRQGELYYTPCVQRNYRKGSVYKAIEEQKEERYFISCGLTPEEASGVFDYFKNMYELRSRFRMAFKEEHNLRYYYSDQGIEVNVELPVCK